MVEGAGFEPAKAVPTDLQSAPFGRLGIPPYLHVWSRRWDSNPQPADYKSAALPVELRRLDVARINYYTRSKRIVKE
jgi:hypothetical protein